MAGIPRVTLASLAAAVWVFYAGRYADTTPAIEQADLLWLFTAASLTGSMLGAVVRQSQDATWWRRLAMPIAVYLIWRVTYFPILVLSGFLAALGETTLGIVYPTFLLSMALFHALAVAGSIPVLVPGSAPASIPARLLVVMLCAASVISFTRSSDLSFLPDSPWQRSPLGIGVQAPAYHRSPGRGGNSCTARPSRQRTAAAPVGCRPAEQE